MDSALLSLIAANVAFVGTHFVLSHPLRAGLVSAMGEKGFMGLYSLVSFATLGWVAVAFRQVGPGGALAWNGQADAPWIVGSLLTVVALALVLASGKGNPALPGMTAEMAAQARPEGAFAITRHPMMWGFALWAAAHVLVAPNPRTTITAGAMAILALVGARLQDRKKQALMGEVWRHWEARTTFWPRWSALGRIGAGYWIGALVLWLALSWAHVWLAGIPAGIWRWLG